MAELNLPVSKSRNFYLNQRIDQNSISDLSRFIIDANEEDEYLAKLYATQGIKYKSKPVKIYIDSFGGNVYACLGLLGIMKSSKTDIHTIVTGCAMSAAFIILISGHIRFAYEKSTFMLHSVSAILAGNMREMEEDIVEYKRLNRSLQEIVLENSKITEKKLQKIYKTKKDWYLDSKKALKFGVIDKII